MTPLIQGESSSFDMSLNKLVLREGMSRNAKLFCSLNDLLTLKQIIGHWQTYHSFKALKRCTDATDLELATICAKYILRPKESEVDIYSYVQKLSSIQKVMFCQLLAIHHMEISQKTLLFLATHLNITESVNKMFGVVYKAIAGQNIVCSKDKCAKELLGLDTDIYQIISTTKNGEGNSLSDLYDKTVAGFRQRHPNKDVFKPECVVNEDGTIRFFQVIDLLIRDGLLFNGKDKQVFFAYFVDRKIIASDVYRWKRDVELGTRLYLWLFSFLFLNVPHHYHPDSDFIIVNKEFVLKLNNSEGVNFTDIFYSRIFKILFQTSHSSIYTVIGMSASKNHLGSIYLVKNDLINAFDWKGFYFFIKQTAAEKRDTEFLLELNVIIKQYISNDQRDQMSRISSLCRNFLLHEFGLSIADASTVIFPCNIVSYFSHIKKLLQESGTAKTLDEIVDGLKKNLPNRSVKKPSIKALISSNRDTFISFGKSGKYGLKNWEVDHPSVKGGSIITAAKKCLENLPRPLHKEELFQQLKEYRQTSCSVMVKRLKSQRPESIFIFFEGGFIGLKNKVYDTKFVIAGKYARIC